jgi:archaemetzincin
MKVATHETGHMFSIPHCTKYECNMCGSNNLAESDRRPVEVCPECLAKICWATDCDPAERFRKLAEFCREQKLEAEQKIYEKLLETVQKGAMR